MVTVPLDKIPTFNLLSGYNVEYKQARPAARRPLQLHGCEPAPGGAAACAGGDPPRGARPRSGLPLRTRFSVLLGKLFVHES